MPTPITFHKFSHLLLRVSIGWLFLYAGFTKLIDPAWSAGGYLNGAKTFSGFYHFLASPSMLPTVNFLNEWGLTLIGLALIFGIGMRYAAYAGAALMMLYYFPILDFPHPNAHAYLVDEHVIYAAALLLLGSAGKDGVCSMQDCIERVWRKAVAKTGIA